jgi:hypothetical protein
MSRSLNMTHLRHASRRIASIALALITAAWSSSAALGQQAIVYVMGPGGNTSAPSDSNRGDSWTNGYAFLHSGLQRASDLLEVNPGIPIRVWVRGSSSGIIYRADQDHIDPDGDGEAIRTFQLKNSVSLYGGFAGSETAEEFALRRPLERLCILSGDLNSDDGAPGNFANYADNTLTIVSAFQVNASAVLDGFVVRAAREHGLSAYQSSARIANCTFTLNKGENVNGGGMFINESSGLFLVNCKFITNHSDHVGGGLSVRNSDSAETLLMNCSFFGNTAVDAGGGVRVGVDSRCTLINCTIAGNVAGPPTSTAFPTGGGGFSLGSDASQPTVRTSELHNSIVWGNAVVGQNMDGPNIALNGVTYGVLEVSHTDSQGGEAGVYIQFNTQPPQGTDVLPWSASNIDADPSFMDAVNGDVHLNGDSPCINIGNNDLVPEDFGDLDSDSVIIGQLTPLDLDLADRFCRAQRVDLGAFEAHEPPVCVDIDGDGQVNIDDLLAVINHWGECPDLPSACPEDLAPLNCGSHNVNIDDLLAVINDWGPCPGFTGESAPMPQSVADCMDLSDINCPGDPDCWAATFQRCLAGLCQAQLIECDE